ncbi:hypothetical protein [Aneurinibacillus aneurinilyticus]|uniref:Uncharacterized protein n=1 Tax=Aneurinibacillus aneurinilyticus TaxID=1391 RepID=A0A848CR72_ANEAE|nr:hypothetical protein [Aneurinibacillus aneurinilyticus]MCI1693189.1 hypothetical protein [Aneurinibacillus aneurinilyticus]NME99944.1 hypothetical protein [Aneurinibacillus aneurinilyticus]
MVIPVIRNESGNESDRLFLLSFLSTEIETKVALRAGTDRKLRMILIGVPTETDYRILILFKTAILLRWERIGVYVTYKVTGMER